MRTDAPMLARYAEGLFWMARYLERVENVARLIDVTQSFESPGREVDAWYALVRINASEKLYAERHGAPDPDRIRDFYLLDRQNPTSVPASIEAARLNARQLRPLISTEMWKHLNVFHREVMATRPDELQGDLLSRLCTRLKEGVQTHTGITEGTFYRDQGWHFLKLGRLIERADQTTRLLDIKYHLLLPVGAEERRVTELSQWGALLRGGAGYHAFRRVASASFTPADVVGFMLNDTAFPRSVVLCVQEMEWHLSQLRSCYGLHGTAASLERLSELRDGLLRDGVDHVIEAGLHEFLDRVQQQLIGIASGIGTAFFRDWRPLLQAQDGQDQVQAMA